MRNLDNPMKQAFDQIHASQELKDRTRRQVLHAMQTRRKAAPALWKPVCALAACLLLVVGLGGYRLYFTPTSVISIDINPSLEVEVNRLGRVIGLQGYNEDGEEFVTSLDVLHQNYQQAVNEILESDTIVERLNEGEFLSVSVVELSGTQGEEITAYVSHCTSGQQNVSCATISPEQAQQAHQVGLSYGKYQIYVDIAAYDPDFTPEEASTMTMRELRDLLASLQQADPDAPDSTVGQGGNGNGYGSGNGYGNGNGAGAGSGNGAGNGNGNGNGSGNGYGNGAGAGHGNGYGKES